MAKVVIEYYPSLKSLSCSLGLSCSNCTFNDTCEKQSGFSKTAIKKIIANDSLEFTQKDAMHVFSAESHWHLLIGSQLFTDETAKLRFLSIDGEILCDNRHHIM